MLRITRISSQDSDTLKLEGKLLGPWVGELSHVLAELNGRAMGLDLSAVTFVDATGTELLRDLIRRGVPIAGCSPFVAELLHK